LKQNEDPTMNAPGPDLSQHTPMMPQYLLTGVDAELDRKVTPKATPQFFERTDWSMGDEGISTAPASADATRPV
jgi:hypothetical protein